MKRKLLPGLTLDATTRKARPRFSPIAACSILMRARTSDSLPHSTLLHPIIRDFANCWREKLLVVRDRGSVDPLRCRFQQLPSLDLHRIEEETGQVRGAGRWFFVRGAPHHAVLRFEQRRRLHSS
jgi:hypothetical protein